MAAPAANPTAEHLYLSMPIAQTILQKYYLVLTVVASLLGFSTHLAIPYLKKLESFANC